MQRQKNVPIFFSFFGIIIWPVYHWGPAAQNSQNHNNIFEASMKNICEMRQKNVFPLSDTSRKNMFLSLSLVY